MDLKVNRKVALTLGLEEGLVYQYLIDNMDRNNELSISYIKLMKGINVLTLNTTKKAVQNLHESDIINNSYDVDGNKVIQVLEIIK